MGTLNTLRFALAALALTVTLAGCDNFFGKKTDESFITPPVPDTRAIAYVAVQPSFSGFTNPVDVIAGNSTDGLINKLDLYQLADDRSYFPPYEAAAVARREALDRHPEIREAIGGLAGKISDDEMRRLNYSVDGEGRDPKDVAREFLSSINR